MNNRRNCISAGPSCRRRRLPERRTSSCRGRAPPTRFPRPSRCLPQRATRKSACGISAARRRSGRRNKKWCSDRSSPMQRFLLEPSVPARRKSLRRPVSARSFLPTAKLRQLHSPERVAAGSPSHQPPRPSAQRSAQRQSQDTPPAPPAGLGPLGPEATRPAPPPATARRPEATLRAFRSPRPDMSDCPRRNCRRLLPMR